MELWLVRHGEAVPESVDPSRPLTPEGRRAVEGAAAFLADRMTPLDLVAASGKKRALETASIVGRAAGYPDGRIVVTPTLSPEASTEAFLGFLVDCGAPARALCVGHLPSIARFASHFLAEGVPVNLRFEPGSVCVIRIAEFRRGGGDLILFV